MKQIIFKNYYSVFTKNDKGKLKHEEDFDSLEKAEEHVTSSHMSALEQDYYYSYREYMYLGDILILPTIKPVEA